MGLWRLEGMKPYSERTYPRLPISLPLLYIISPVFPLRLCLVHCVGELNEKKKGSTKK